MNNEEINQINNRENDVKIIAILGLSHMFVDTVCISGILSLSLLNNLISEHYITLIVLYNVIAFGSQSVVGFICDEIGGARIFVIVGGLLSIVGLLFLQVPIVALIFFSLGNSFFHIGGGVISLSLQDGKAKYPGLFVAPGAIGVFVATLIKADVSIIYVMGGLLFICIVGSCLLTKTATTITNNEISLNKNNINSRFIVAIICLLLVISVRSLIGSALSFPWRLLLEHKILLVAAVVMGKALGGIIGDRFGFLKIGVGGLIISSVLLAFGMENIVLSLAGIFLFNITMPITLTALANQFKEYKGFAFGLTTLALALGYLLVKSLFGLVDLTNISILAIILISAILLTIGIVKSEVV